MVIWWWCWWCWCWSQASHVVVATKASEVWGCCRRIVVLTLAASRWRLQWVFFWWCLYRVCDGKLKRIMSICDEAVGDCEPDESKDGNHRRYVPFRTCVSRTSSNNGWIIRIAKSLPRSANTAAAMTAFTLLVLVCIAYSCKAGVLDIIWDLDFVCSCQRLCPRTHRHIP